MQPLVFYSVPRIWEKFYEKITEVGAKSGFLKKSIAQWARNQSTNYYQAIREGRLVDRFEMTLRKKILRFNLESYLLLKNWNWQLPGKQFWTKSRKLWDSKTPSILLQVNNTYYSSEFLFCNVYATGSAPIDPIILEFFLGLDIPIMELYGLSESLSIATLSLLKEEGWKFGSVGKVKMAKT